MNSHSSETFPLLSYIWLAAGFLLLLVNHLSVITGDPWMIPSFMRLY